MSGTKTTEQAIFDNIPDLDVGGSDDDTADTSSQTTQQPAGQGTSAGGNTASATTQPASGGGEVRSGNTQATQATQAATEVTTDIQRKDGYVERPNKDNPRLRDIVNPATGEVIAHGGRERGFFEAAQKANIERQQLGRQLDRVNQQLQQAQQGGQQNTEVTQAVQTAGIDHQSHVQAINIMGRFLKDPVGVLSDLVIEVKSKGYNIPFLEQGVTPGMDAAATQRMIEQQMRPITSQHQAQAEQQRVQNDARQQLDSFLTAEPDAASNLGIIGEMLTQDRSLNLYSAWTKLVRAAYVAGLDPAQPLGPQYQARMNEQQQQQSPVTANNSQQPQQAAPLPNGRQAATQATVPVQDARQFDENSSYGDIIRHAMRQSGYTTQ